MSAFLPAALEEGRPPQQVLPGLWVFPPNRDTQGGTAWLLSLPQRPPVLIDCPALTAANLAALAGPPGVIVLTGRAGHGRCRRLQEAIGWPVLVQEQEAYLLPGLPELRPFGAAHDLADDLRLLWTPGPSPGACVLHATGAHDLLFCGRLLVPLAPGRLGPLRSAHTFHWPRQQRSLELLQHWLPAGSPRWIATGAGLGALRGEKLVPGTAQAAQ